jgi:hypothetical protein
MDTKRNVNPINNQHGGRRIHNAEQQQIFFIMKMNTTQLIEKAAELANNPSAIFCANQAKAICSIERSAKMWALKSIAHSVGIFHPIYISNDWE